MKKYVLMCALALSLAYVPAVAQAQSLYNVTLMQNYPNTTPGWSTVRIRNNTGQEQNVVLSQNGFRDVTVTVGPGDNFFEVPTAGQSVRIGNCPSGASCGGTATMPSSPNPVATPRPMPGPDLSNEVADNSASVAANTNRLNQHESRLNAVEAQTNQNTRDIKRTQGGVAQAVAMSQMSFDRNAVGALQVGVGYGNFNNRHGFAVGVGYAPNRDVILRGSVATSGNNNHSFGVGATFTIR